MKIKTVFIILVLLFLGGCSIGNMASKKETSTSSEFFTNVSALEGNKIINENKNNPNFIILDIRKPDEYNLRHIDGAILIDFYNNDFRDQLDKLDKNKTYFLYGNSGRRTEVALKWMKEQGFHKIYHLKNGIVEWRRNKLPLIE